MNFYFNIEISFFIIYNSIICLQTLNKKLVLIIIRIKMVNKEAGTGSTLNPYPGACIGKTRVPPFRLLSVPTEPKAQCHCSTKKTVSFMGRGTRTALPQKKPSKPPINYVLNL